MLAAERNGLRFHMTAVGLAVANQRSPPAYHSQASVLSVCSIINKPRVLDPALQNSGHPSVEYPSSRREPIGRDALDRGVATSVACDAFCGIVLGTCIDHPTGLWSANRICSFVHIDHVEDQTSLIVIGSLLEVCRVQSNRVESNQVCSRES